MYPKVLRALGLYCCIVFFPLVVSGNQDVESAKIVDSIIEEAGKKGLSENPYWKDLLHFRDQKASKITSPEFFMAGNGKFDAAAELHASIRGFYEPLTGDPEKHAICRFPARYHWLSSQLPIDIKRTPETFCPGLREWSERGKIRSVSLVFVTGYLQNPASFYGHILLKFNSSTNSPMIDNSLDYGAIIDHQDSMPVYMYKALTGGYEAGFTHSRYYKRNHDYAELDLRNLWEYELNLTDFERTMLIAHAYEVLGKKRQYKFITENCATALIELLELVIQEELMDDGRFWVVPSGVFFNLAEKKRLNGSLTKEPVLHPSRQSRLHQRYTDLDDKDKELVRQIIQSDQEGKTEFGNIDSSINPHEVIDTLIDYYRIKWLQSTAGKRGEIVPEAENYEDYRKQLLIARMRLPAIEEKEPDYQYIPPHKGQAPTTVRIGSFDHNLFGQGTSFQFRPVYFDFLGEQLSLPRFSELSLFDMEFYYYEQDKKLRLSRLDIFNARTLRASTTDLGDDTGWGWAFRLSLEELDNTCRDCLLARFYAGFSRTLWSGKRNALYVQNDFVFQDSRHGTGKGALHPHLGLVFSLGDNWRSAISVGRWKYPGGNEREFETYSWENRFGAGKNWDIRLGWEKAVYEQYSASFSVYF